MSPDVAVINSVDRLTLQDCISYFPSINPALRLSRIHLPTPTPHSFIDSAWARTGRTPRWLPKPAVCAPYKIICVVNGPCYLEVFAAFSLVLTGVACWDVLSTLWFEWQIITGKRKWRWPMVGTHNGRHSTLSLISHPLFCSARLSISWHGLACFYTSSPSPLTAMH